MRLLAALFAFLLFLTSSTGAQQSGDKDNMPGMDMGTPPKNQQSQQKKKDDSMKGMPGMDDGQMPGMQMGQTGLITMHPETFVQEIVRHGTSGTSAEPDSTPLPMLMATKGAWTLMFHANVFLVDEQQSSPRGAR